MVVTRLPYVPPAPERNDRPIRDGRIPPAPGADKQAERGR